MITNLNFVLTQTELTNLVHAHIRAKLAAELDIDGIEVTLVEVGKETRASVYVTLVKPESFFK